MTAKITKKQKRRLRELAEAAHETDLGREVDLLLQQIQEWKAGEKNVFELNEEIHRFHDQISRGLYKLYVMGPPTFAVAQAIHLGLLEKEQIEPDILELLKLDLQFLQDFDSEGRGT